MPRKVCTKCGEDKDVTEFHRHSQNNGYRPQCKLCRAVSKGTGKRFGPNSHLFGIFAKKSRAQIAKENYERYPEKSAQRAAKRRAAKRQATVEWANEFFIEEAYHLAKVRSELFGFQWEVDHIIPLQGRVACGLHVETNLQVIPWLDNVRKGNRLCLDA